MIALQIDNLGSESNFMAIYFMQDRMYYCLGNVSFGTT